MFLAFILLIAIVFVIDCIVAAVSMWVSQFTGLVALEGLDFWNWFAIVILVQILTWAGVARNS